MSSKKNIYLLLSLIILSTLLIALLLIGNNNNNVLIDKEIFKVDNQQKINRIVINKKNEQINLSYNGIKWVVNDSLEADRQLIQVFFATLLQAEPKRAISQKLSDSVAQSIIQFGTKIDLYEEATLVKSFSVLGNENKNETVYKLENDPQPYLVTIPGYKVYVAGIFELSTMDWRDKRIFNFNWQNFKQLTATFTSEPKENFTISFQNGFFGIEGNPEADTTNLNNYLDAVSLLQTSHYIRAEEMHQYDSLFKAAPNFSIVVSDIANRMYSLRVFNTPVNVTYVPAILNDREAILIDLNELLRIYRKRSYFLK
jgi:hypothetical protein